MKIIYGIAFQFIAEKIVEYLEGRNDDNISPKDVEPFKKYTSKLGNKLRNANSIEDFVYCAVDSHKLRSILKAISGMRFPVEGRKSKGTINEEVEDEYEKPPFGRFLEKAELIYTIAKQGSLLAHLYQELFIATIPGYNPRFKGIFIHLEREAEKNITSLVDILSAHLMSRSPTYEAGVIEDIRALVKHAALFAHLVPAYVKKKSTDYDSDIAVMYVPVDGELEYASLADHLDNTRTKYCVNINEEANLVSKNECPYISRRRAKRLGIHNVSFSFRVKFEKGEEYVVKNTGRKYIDAPVSNAAFSGNGAAVEGETKKFEKYLSRVGVVALKLDTQDVLNILTNQLGLGQTKIQQLREIGALARASPVLDLVTEYALTNQDDYRRVGHKENMLQTTSALRS